MFTAPFVKVNCLNVPIKYWKLMYYVWSVFGKVARNSPLKQKMTSGLYAQKNTSNIDLQPSPIFLIKLLNRLA